MNVLVNIQLIVILVLILLASRSHGDPSVPPRQITKHINTDTNTSLYSANFLTGDFLFPVYPYITTNFLIDLDATLIWYNCILQDDRTFATCPPDSVCLNPFSCVPSYCAEVRSSTSSSCPPTSNTSSLPDCGCPVNVVNPVTGSCVEAELGYDKLYLDKSCGICIAYVPYNLNSACAPSSVFQSFPESVTGVMALSSSPYGLLPLIPTAPVLALCLPSSSSAPGALLLGSDDPVYLSPGSNVTVKSLLSYTPLLKQPNSFSYFIGVEAILVNKKAIDVLARRSTATAKLSTIVPYTTLRTDVYDRLIKGFSDAAKKVDWVDPVQPFGLCFNTSGLGRHSRVPDIAFDLGKGVKWSMFEANWMKQMSKDVGCLAFVDGGTETEYEIVIGTQQMEDNLLEIDVGNSTFGFTSSLLSHNTSCSNLSFSQA